MLKEIASIGSTVLKLPNSVAIASSGHVIVADGYKNKIYCFDPMSGQAVSDIGRLGAGRYSFKEPVGAFAFKNDADVAYIGVADWHNHRILLYDEELRYVSSFGGYGLLPDGGVVSPFIRLLRFIRNLPYAGSYIAEHYSGNDPQLPRETGPLRCAAISLMDWITDIRCIEGRPGFLMNKPNGLCFCEGKLIATQKNARSVVAYDLEASQVQIVARPGEAGEFGRLGQVSYSKASRHVLVCDPTNKVVWKSSPSLTSWKALPVSSEPGGLSPFSAIEVGQLTFVCGGDGLAVFHSESWQKVDEIRDLGEPHGIAYHEGLRHLAVADRLGGVVRRFLIDYKAAQL